MIKKKNVHFNKYADFLGKKLSANVENTKYYILSDETNEIKEGEPDIMYQSFVVIKDVKKFWTHGVLYDFIQRDESEETERVILQSLMDLENNKLDKTEFQENIEEVTFIGDTDKILFENGSGKIVKISLLNFLESINRNN